jgi:nucleotide-binding universal stress UspA family protein
MSYRDLLVYLDATPASLVRLDLAVQLAERFEARLIGVDASTLGAFEGPRHEIAVSIIDRFEETARQHGLVAKFHAADSAPAGSAFFARYADLVIAGQRDPEQSELVLRGVPLDVLLAGGRPMLLVPYTGRPEAVGTRVLIAWNGSREATRAVHDALPLMRGAVAATILALDLPPDGGEDIDLLCEHLGHHGLAPDVERMQSEDIAPSDLLLSRAADLDVDLIVMGAYGHSRLREYVLGGMTRDILDRMTAPVLMSH